MKLDDIVNKTQEHIDFITNLKDACPYSIADKIIQFILKPDINPYFILEFECAEMCHDCTSMVQLHDFISLCEKDGHIDFVRTSPKRGSSYNYMIILSNTFERNSKLLPSNLIHVAPNIGAIEILDNEQWDIYHFLQEAEDVAIERIKLGFRMMARQEGLEKAVEHFKTNYESFNQDWVDLVR